MVEIQLITITFQISQDRFIHKMLMTSAEVL